MYLQNLKPLGKKGAAFRELWQAALGLGIFSLVLVLVSFMTEEVQDITEDTPNSETYTNVSITWTSNSTNATIHVSTTNVVSIQNTTLTIGAANYTVFGTLGRITCCESDNISAVATYNITYTFNADSAAYNITVESLDAIDLLSDWQSIVVIAVIMIVVIGLIMSRLGYIG